MRSPFSFICRRACVVTGFGAGASGTGGAQRLQLRELAEPKIAVGQLGMGIGESRLGDDPITIADDVEVQRARPPALAPIPAPLALDPQQYEQHVTPPERRLEQRHLI